MRNKGKKLVGLIAVLATLGASMSFAACGDPSHKGEDLDGFGPAATAEVSSNGGFAVKKGDYVYFINGAESYTADNTYGKVVKGALMCVDAKSWTGDVSARTYDNAKVVVKELFAAQNYNAGIYIFDDYVYYATPSTGKDSTGATMSSYLSFKRAKLDGTAAPEKEFFHLSSNTVNYRFVKDNGVVYCLYEDTDDAGVKCLMSYNTQEKKHVTLVKGAKSSFFYDTKNLDNPRVYYTMAVTENADSDYATTEAYDQLYTVTASATATTSVADGKASYTVKDGATYSFDADYIKDNDGDVKDYATYPYVNLGTLALDGIGKNPVATQYTQQKTERGDKAIDTVGFNYTISRYENGGVYFTRAWIALGSVVSDTNLYFMNDSEVDASKSVDNNDLTDDIVAKNTTNASSTAMFAYDAATDTHTYYYVSGDNVYKTTAKNGEEKTYDIARQVTGATLLQMTDSYLYYYTTDSSTNGRALSRVKCDGEEKHYNGLLGEQNYKEYQPQTLPLVTYSDSWYQPEIFEGLNTVLYPNAQSFGKGNSGSHEYVYAAALDQIAANEEKYEKVTEYLKEYENETTEQALITYFFRTDLTPSDKSKAEYDEEFYNEVVEKFGKDGLVKEKEIIHCISKMTDEDIEDIENDWADSLLQPDEVTTEEEGLEGWAIALIVVGSVLVVGAGITIPVVIAARKKAAKKREEEATVNAYKRKKIDTTDDKSIDVYADETQEATEAQAEEAKQAEPAEEPAEESTEEAVETTTDAE